MGNLVVAQSGGPTAAINATLVGVISYAKESKQIKTIYGAKYGIEGMLAGEFFNFNAWLEQGGSLEQLLYTPSSALGSCRKKLEDGDEDTIQELIQQLKKKNIEYVLYIGGNDSMDTVAKLSKYCKENGIFDLTVVGIPKTIDNDLVGIDHCPGFGSAARYVATTCMELKKDSRVYNLPSVTIVEVMGRNAGWLTAASALSRENGQEGVDLIYVCERPFSKEQFIDDILELQKKQCSILIAVSEGLQGQDGTYLAEQEQEDVDDFGHPKLSGVGSVLEQYVREKIGCKVRSVELNVMQRCSGHITSKVDLVEAKTLGEKGCQYALEKKNGAMATLRRLGNAPYQVEYYATDVEQVANREKKIPLVWIVKEGNNVTREMVDYLKPLIQGEWKVRLKDGVPEYVTLF